MSEIPGLNNGIEDWGVTDDEAKLVFGTAFSLRNMVRKLGGEDDR